MAIDAWTIIITAMCTGIGVSVGNGLFEAFFKDYFKKLKAQNKKLKRLQRRLKNRLLDYKRPWIALLLNLFLWGTGYFYVKRKRLLGVLLLLIQIFVIGGFASGQGSVKNVFEGVSSGFLTIIVAIYLGIDAYHLAQDVNKGK
jgi:hypothetical protein